MEKHLKIARFLANLLDEEFKILGFKFGLDPLIGLIPGLGDALPFLLMGYMIWIGHELGMSLDQKLVMVRNSILDFLVGLIPVIGDLADFGFKSNKMNWKILDEHSKKTVRGEILSSD